MLQIFTTSKCESPGLDVEANLNFRIDIIARKAPALTNEASMFKLTMEEHVESS